MGLKYAGSANRQAYKTLLDSVRSTMTLLTDQELLDQVGESKTLFLKLFL